MKQFILTAAALTFGATAAHAQKGSVYVGGQAGFNSTSTTVDNKSTSVTTDKRSNWSFSPEVGTFLTDHVQLGVGFVFSGSKVTDPVVVGHESSSKVNRYGGTVYSRYFFGEGNFRPFVGVNVQALPGSGTTESGGLDNHTTKYSTFDFGANLNAGFGYGLNDHLTVVGSFGSLGFQSSSSKQKGTDTKTTTSTFGLDANSLGNRFTVGVYYTL